MRKEKIKAIFKKFQQINPEPTTELKYQSDFELLIAVILSAQATDISVNKATDKLFLHANTPEKMLNLGEEKLQEYIKTIGLYRAKAKNIILTCEKLIKEHGSKVPHERAALEALPGVGRKTANVILNTFHKLPVIAVDTHIFRVAQRIGLASGKTPIDIEKQLMKAIPEEFLLHAHHWLILHGRYICTARNPKCPICPISEYCQYYANLKSNQLEQNT